MTPVTPLPSAFSPSFHFLWFSVRVAQYCPFPFPLSPGRQPLRLPFPSHHIAALPSPSALNTNNTIHHAYPIVPVAQHLFDATLHLRRHHCNPTTQSTALRTRLNSYLSVLLFQNGELSLLLLSRHADLASRYGAVLLCPCPLRKRGHEVSLILTTPATVPY